MDEVRRAVFFVYANMVTYAIVVVGTLTLFTLVLSWPIPLLGVGIFSVLLGSHALAYYVLRAPIGEAGLSRWFNAVGAAYLALVILSVAVAILAGP